MSSSTSKDDEQALALATNRASWNRIAHSTKGRTALPNYGPLCDTEESLQLLGDLTGKRVIELGCGDGQSLVYLHKQGAIDLHGLDLADEQVNGARAKVKAAEFEATVLCSPMELDPGIPHQHFDLAISLYALGWSTDLDAALAHIANYLGPGGRLVFSWEHPMYSCLKRQDDLLYLGRSYSEVGPAKQLSWNGDAIVMQARKVSCFLNAVIGAGLVLDEVIEADLPSEGVVLGDYPRRWYCKDKARLMPTTLIVCAHKT